MTERKQFRIESKELMELLIHAVYSNKDIFLRELIANASDACDKKYFDLFSRGSDAITKDAFEVLVQVDREKRILTVSDNGIGMSEQELEDYLGRIAFSGTKVLSDVIKKKLDIDMIGQFGIGFYSAFLISDRVEVITRKYGEEKTIVFVSDGMDGYAIYETNEHTSGTTVRCYIKSDTKSENYSQYLDLVKIKGIIKRYSNFIRYSIVVLERGEKVLVNDKTPLWIKNASEVTESDNVLFYKNHFNDKNDPLLSVRMTVEGTPSFKALLYVPGYFEKQQHNLEQNDGIQIYIKNNFVQNNCNHLFPKYLSFLNGIIDSPDIGLSISRELPNDDANLNKIVRLVEKRILTELKSLLSKDREKYIQFWEEYRDRLLQGQKHHGHDKSSQNIDELYLFKSSFNEDYTTLNEYLSRNAKAKDIYYIVGKSIAQIKTLPQYDIAQKENLEVLYVLDYKEELYVSSHYFAGNIAFKNISKSSTIVETIEEKREISTLSKENEPLLDELRSILSQEVDTVELSLKSQSHPVYLEETGRFSAGIERVFRNSAEIKSRQKLIINPHHGLLEKLNDIYRNHPNKLKDYAYVLYNNARLIHGMDVDNPTKLSQLVIDLMMENK